jgi:hypothetical protein
MAPFHAFQILISPSLVRCQIEFYFPRSKLARAAMDLDFLGQPVQQGGQQSLRISLRPALAKGRLLVRRATGHHHQIISLHAARTSSANNLRDYMAL